MRTPRQQPNDYGAHGAEPWQQGTSMRFRDRRAAGTQLADRLLEWAAGKELTDPLVSALPRGGVPVAAEIAPVLDAELDIPTLREAAALPLPTADEQVDEVVAAVVARPRGGLSAG